jgi:hypothetical protein
MELNVRYLPDEVHVPEFDGDDASLKMDPINKLDITTWVL